MRNMNYTPLIYKDKTVDTAIIRLFAAQHNTKICALKAKNTKIYANNACFEHPARDKGEKRIETV
jgi:hypothetical protein